MTKESFRQALNQKFVLRANAEQTLELNLTSVSELTLHAPDKERLKREPFSLMFHGPLTPWAQQHTYRLENETLGALDIFLVPIGRKENVMQYEAVFT